MEGSSAFQFGRAAYRAGLISRRQLAADAWANIRFRLRGSTDADTHALRDRISSSLAGTRVRDLERLGADVLAGVLPRIYPQMLARRPRAPGRRPPGLHRHRGLAGAGGDAGSACWRSTARSARSSPRCADGVYTGEPGRPVHLPERQGPGDRGAGRARGDRPGRVLRVLRLGVRSADAPGGRPPGRGQPRPRSWPASPASRAGRSCASTASAGGSRPASALAGAAAAGGIGAARCGGGAQTEP